MTKLFTLKASLIAAAILALPMAQAATMAKADYKIDKQQISTSYKTDKAACDPLKANAKDICVEEAKAKEKVAKAELEFNYTGKANDGNKVLVAKAEAAYAVAKEKCDDLAGNTKDVCVKEAKAAETTAKADAKAKMKTADANATAGEKTADARSDASKKTVDARKDATEDKTDAQYAVAKEKCDAYSGAAKDSCLDKAKLGFNK